MPGRRTPGPNLDPSARARTPPGRPLSPRLRLSLDAKTCLGDPFEQILSAGGDYRDREPSRRVRTMRSEPPSGNGLDIGAVVRAVVLFGQHLQLVQPPEQAGDVVRLDHEQGMFARPSGCTRSLDSIKAAGSYESSTTWAELPSTPEQPTSARRGPSIRSRSQYCGPRGEVRPGATSRFGGKICWCKQRAALTSEASPEAAPAWPTFALALARKQESGRPMSMTSR